MYTVVACC